MSDITPIPTVSASVLLSLPIIQDKSVPAAASILLPIPIPRGQLGRPAPGLKRKFPPPSTTHRLDNTNLVDQTGKSDVSRKSEKEEKSDASRKSEKEEKSDVSRKSEKEEKSAFISALASAALVSIAATKEPTTMGDALCLLEKNLVEIVQTQIHVMNIEEERGFYDDAEAMYDTSMRMFSRYELLSEIHISTMELQICRIEKSEDKKNDVKLQDKRLLLIDLVAKSHSQLLAEQFRQAHHRIEMQAWRRHMMYQYGNEKWKPTAASFKTTFETIEKKLHALTLPKDTRPYERAYTVSRHIEELESEHVRWIQSQHSKLESAMEKMGTCYRLTSTQEKMKRIESQVKRQKREERHAQQASEATQAQIDQIQTLQQELIDSKRRRQEHEKEKIARQAKLDQMMRDV
jgi:hypothetical protein